MRHFALLLSSLIAIGGFSVHPASAHVQHPAQLRAVTAAPALSHEVFGFALASSLGDPTLGYPSWNFSLLSTVAFFGLHVQDDGTFAADSNWAVWNSPTFTNFVNAAHASGTKVVLTIILQDFSAGTPHMCSGLWHFPTTVSNSVNQMRAKGLDGINVDYEGLNGSCGNADPSWARHDFSQFIMSLRNSTQGSVLSVDSYASSASDSLGFFDIPALGPLIDYFFVMAYDLEYSNYGRSPTSCGSFCLGPTAPLSAYYYNDSSTAQDYIAAAGASKVVLGVPYYGRKACVAGPSPNAYPIGGVSADDYLDAESEWTSNLVRSGSYEEHRDANDPSGGERWDTWFNTQLGCTRELYWDDTVSLGRKYALANADNLRGVGIWNLNYGGGKSELWALISTYFQCLTSINLPATEGGTGFTVPLTAGNCSVAYFDVQQYDSTLNEGWFGMIPAGAGGGATGTALAEGYQGHTYQFRARAHAVNGYVSPWATASTQVAANATKARPWSGLYTLDGYGGVHMADSPPLDNAPYWPWTAARAVKPLPGASAPQSGLVLDAWGGLHPFGSPAIQVAQEPYYPNLDVARDFVFLPNGTGGYELDGWGGIHPFSLGSNPLPPLPSQYPYFPGQDVAKKITLLPDAGGGYVLDAFGGLHPWSVAGHALPSGIAAYGYWPGQNIARDMWLAPSSSASSASGYVLDAYGGFHPFWTRGASAPAPVAAYG
ncbi:MAG TPA: glycosyl hydrolase family 18 protein, partial [Candidatus Dormibacteraeota bacterium]|nr:glycosyl hydrolase family 18 protein [Candidatus Dormibacteraeota bacterium]